MGVVGVVKGRRSVYTVDVPILSADHGSCAFKATYFSLPGPASSVRSTATTASPLFYSTINTYPFDRLDIASQGVR